ncbi:hypothetical protein [Acidianus sp. HS-5]|uniref:GH12 family glycosyl hydrolase domain-containing protein n=1 Tax=Acidianus sp. HS-5 TaxID=2886040 RepID=UPI001F2F9A81|nr:hypothetical protein [Acidianus sp. HS-5]BDC17886.1 endoglucanase [Acidianus sp. HS-5]
MKKIVIVGSSVLILVIFLSILLLSLHPLNITTPVKISENKSSIISQEYFSILGSYKSDSEYAMGEIYLSNCSYFVSPFLWNLKYADGETNMTFKNGVLYVDINFSNFKKINPNIPVDGYPGLMYGHEGWFPFAGTTIENPSFTLPKKACSLPNVTSTLNFSVWIKEGKIDDFSYDIWLTQNPNVTYLAYPSIELMIWLYHNESLSSYFIKEGEVEVTLCINGTSVKCVFTVYILPHTGSSNGWIGVYYLSHKNLEGKVSIPLTFFIKNEFQWINKVFEINESSYYLDGVQVGMEFNDYQVTAELGYTLYCWILKPSYL